MADIVSADVRSRMMSGIRGKNTRPELALRHALHSLGFRYRINDRLLPGKPDIVLPRWRAAVFVHGCFWHGHDCGLYKVPATNPEFWLRKVEDNQGRDARAQTRLREMGWRVATVWECAMRGKEKRAPAKVAAVVSDWLRSERDTLEIRG